jgi:hypothetical protein
MNNNKENQFDDGPDDRKIIKLNKLKQKEILPSEAEGGDSNKFKEMINENNEYKTVGAISPTTISPNLD